MDAQDAKWIATLSDGTTAVEHSGEWKIIPGERKPWIRFCKFAEENGLHLTSLRLNFRGRTIHLPRPNFDRFDYNERHIAPLYYSLAYHLEVDDPLSGQAQPDFFIDLAAHYDAFAVHYIQDISDGSNSWIVVTDPAALAPSPRRDRAS